MENRCVGSFVTLTYSDDHYENHGYHDIQAFHNRLRYLHKVRFYCAPDVGDQFGRFHWHVLYFGIDGNCSKAQDDIKRSWRLGYADVRPLVPERIGYACGYVTKKLAGLDAGRPNMSQGLGKAFFLHQGQALASTRDVLYRYPYMFKIGKRPFPIDATCRKWLIDSYLENGGALDASAYAPKHADWLDLDQQELEQERLGGAIGEDLTKRYMQEKAGIYGETQLSRVKATIDGSLSEVTKRLNRQKQLAKQDLQDDTKDSIAF